MQYVVDAVRGPAAELTRHQRRLRRAWDLGTHCLRVLQRHRAEGMAAELTYRTIFALIPLVVLSLVTFRVIGGLEEVERQVEDQLYSFFGVPEIPLEAYVDEPAGDAEEGEALIEGPAAEDVEEVVPPGAALPEPEIPEADVPEADVLEASPPEIGAPDSAAPEGAVAPAEKSEAEAAERAAAAAVEEQTQATIRWALRELTSKVASLDFASIGILGLLLFIYAAIALADSVESVFNLIYEAPAGRPIHIRLAIHWSILTLGSGLLAMSLYMSGRIVDYLSTESGLPIGWYVRHVVALLASWILLFLLYALMPNTKVSTRAAAVGGLVAATLWEVAKLGFQLYVATAVPYSAFYGSLGLIPLFLFWVYITWFIFLFGLVWAYTLQTARGHVPTKAEDEIAEDLLLGDPHWLLLLMVEVAAAFEQGEALDRTQLQQRLGLPSRVLLPLCETLEKSGLLRRIECEHSDQFVPARPAERITVADIVQAGRFTPANPASKSWTVLGGLLAQVDSELGQRTLAELSYAQASSQFRPAGIAGS
ncbi:YhjD/YihY/BrkB family envelope integrity protein [Candidatus Laterigemmans baculatus]|uniref:YhjD/YihY/BrkB family envelope integrity protein n=1 Tax=Candidatus Laterigemmans baculatus TaxID=2770505 RepID=UPI001F2FE628|nr:YhjD/YihY/BrkB family envelope integrity protein [Candidatus Laterigemmans baculatus]